MYIYTFVLSKDNRVHIHLILNKDLKKYLYNIKND
jgi:hypothetical protein